MLNEYDINRDCSGLNAIINEYINVVNRINAVSTPIRPRIKTTRTTRTASDILDDIKQVIFNDPATIVTFKDGTKVCVKACEQDGFNKETGLIYAIVKRLYANDVDENGYLKSRGLGEKIGKIVANAFDQKEQERIQRQKRKDKKAESAKKGKAANEAGEKSEKESVKKVHGDGAAKKPESTSSLDDKKKQKQKQKQKSNR